MHAGIKCQGKLFMYLFTPLMFSSSCIFPLFQFISPSPQSFLDPVNDLLKQSFRFIISLKMSFQLLCFSTLFHVEFYHCFCHVAVIESLSLKYVGILVVVVRQVKDGDQDFGWGCVINFQKKNNQKVFAAIINIWIVVFLFIQIFHLN